MASICFQTGVDFSVRMHTALRNLVGYLSLSPLSGEGVWIVAIPWNFSGYSAFWSTLPWRCSGERFSCGCWPMEKLHPEGWELVEETSKGFSVMTNMGDFYSYVQEMNIWEDPRNSSHCTEICLENLYSVSIQNYPDDHAQPESNVMNALCRKQPTHCPWNSYSKASYNLSKKRVNYNNCLCI